MKIDYTKRFLKNFAKRIAPNQNLDRKFKERVKQFAEDPSSKVLKNHKLSGTLEEFRSFSITGDIRVIYRQISSDTVEFYDIGTHNQIYK